MDSTAGMSAVAGVASLAPDQALGISLGVFSEWLTAAGPTGERAATASGNADTGVAFALLVTPES